MKKLKITYWTMGDSLTERTVEVADFDAATIEAEIKKLGDDEQAPLGQVDHIVLLEE